MLYTKLVETELHQNDNVISEANIKYANFCDILAEQSQDIQDWVLVSNYLIKAITYKSILDEHKTLLQDAVINSVEEALERLNMQHLLDVTTDK